MTTNIVFAINQLSPSSIGISPLTTIHLRTLQRSIKGTLVLLLDYIFILLTSFLFK